MAYSYESQHIVHPTTLDSIIQAAYAPLVSSGPIETAFVPRRVKKLRISSALSSLGVPGAVLETQVSMTKRTANSFSTDLSVSEKAAKKDHPEDVLIEVEGLAFQSLGANLSASAKETSHETQGCWSWSPDITLMPLSQLIDQLHAETAPGEKDLIMELRRCTTHFIKSTLDQLTNDDNLASQDRLGRNSSSWILDSPEQQTHTRAAVLAGEVNGEMICRLGPKLLDMLRHRAEPLELMMQDKLLSRYYAEVLKWNRSKQPG